MDINIQHNKNSHYFYTYVSGEICTLMYKIIDDKTLDYYHTFVPESLRNKGIAGKLTVAALDYAVANQYHVVPSCPFVEKYIEAHPKYASVINSAS